MRYHTPLQRAVQALFLLLCAAGVFSGVLLLLYPPAQHAADDPSRPADHGAAPVSVPLTEIPKRTPRYALFSPDDLSEGLRPSAGYDGVLTPMKDPEGRLAYVSSLPMAAEWGTSDDRLTRTESIRTAHPENGLRAVAAVSCLRDGALTRVRPDLALMRESGAVWTDREGIGWLDPARPLVRTYLAGVCRELALLGFDEILLRDCGYPVPTETGPVVKADRREVLDAFCRRLQADLADLPVILSIEAMADEEGLLPDSGQSDGLLASFSGGVWCSGEARTALARFQPTILPKETSAELP